MKCIASVIKGLLLISAILAFKSSLQDASAYVIDRECYVVLYENVTTCFYGCGTLSRQGRREIIEVKEVGLKDGTPCMISPEMNGTCKNFICEENAA